MIEVSIHVPCPGCAQSVSLGATHTCLPILDLFIPGELSNPLNGSHRHWSVRARWAKTWRTKAHLLVSARPEARDVDPAKPKIIRFIANLWNLMDEDGLRASLKPALDGLRDAGVIHSDGPKSGHLFVYGQRIDRGRRGVRILVEPQGGP